MAIAERQRQPDRLLALADENLLVGIGHLVVGRSHCIASSRGPEGFEHRDKHIASWKWIETFRRDKRRVSGPETARAARQDSANPTSTLALLQHSSRD
jgi:hypothetical protein